ncbi:unannotated protein [freshwater metagenome]|uniref:Unannotated protein n=1 Tax=freshwater metagenome TaxID=449393 RepID=A0A6J6C469_9ZZZZ
MTSGTSISSSETSSSNVTRRFGASFPRSRATEIGSLDAIGSATPPSVAASITGVATFFGSPPSKPAATTVIRTSSPSASSIVVPKMNLAFGCTAD